MSSRDEAGSPNRREEGSNAGYLALQKGGGSHRIEYRGNTIVESAPTDEEIKQRLDNLNGGEKRPPQKLPADVRQAYRAAKQASRKQDTATRAYVTALRSGQPIPAAVHPTQRARQRGAEQRTLFEFEGKGDIR